MSAEINTSSTPPSKRDLGAWARPVGVLKVGEIPVGAINLNVEGRQLTGPVRGFGQLWQKTYRIRLAGIQMTPAELISEWKANFGSFWPRGNHFYGPDNGILPGEVAVLNLAGPNGMQAPGGQPVISTGVMVIYADDEAFTFMTPQGHMFGGIITFSASEEEGDCIAQIQALVRASDPIYELTFRLGFGHKMENTLWVETLSNLARHFGVTGALVKQDLVVIDPRLQWSQMGNLWHNAAIRTGLYVAASPVRRAYRWIRGK